MCAYEKDNREALVDLDDVAEVLAKVVAEGPTHYGATYELSATQNPTKSEIAEALSEAFGRHFSLVRYPASFEHRPEIFGDVDEAHARHQMDTLRAVHGWYEAHDFVGNGNVLRMLLGREPTSFVDFVRKHFGLNG
jgi:nucleoside-diphosphate-sugar epimerase